MKNISLAIDDDLFRQFSVACAEAGAKKKTIIINFIKDFIESKEDNELLELAMKRSKRIKEGKAKLIDLKDVKKQL